ncbi:CASP domain-containing protein [Lasiodiplodia theobromae]|uniref:CASP domain-containing protein n=1 Tax=Lasiodiplodia theobromae TaxID=45133 RepID=UPI0015C3F893|nr:CASP domain-containing protein [Lasiodiplodia theobromae]KAF4545513.1 CASP domain-containing protein [Lasiodiplodia theobromae]
MSFTKAKNEKDFKREFESLGPTISTDEDDGGGFATVVDYRTLYTGKPTGQRKARATTASELSPDSILDNVIGLLNVIVAQNDRLTERNEELGDEIRRLRGALETSEEMQYPALAQLLGIGHFRLEPVCKPYLRYSPVYEIK